MRKLFAITVAREFNRNLCSCKHKQHQATYLSLVAAIFFYICLSFVYLCVFTVCIYCIALFKLFYPINFV